MDKLIINGMVPLNGEVVVSGAKNAVLPMLCASVMVGSGSEKQKCHYQEVVLSVQDP